MTVKLLALFVHVTASFFIGADYIVRRRCYYDEIVMVWCVGVRVCECVRMFA